MFLDLKPQEGTISFGGNGQGKINDIGKVGFKHNLLSISQFCDNEFTVSFEKYSCIAKRSDDTSIFSIKRNNNLYKIKLEDLNKQNVTCLVSKEDKR
ncbi:hypothetical protein CR513_43914, partial [Mucuna pruriens]